MISQIDPKCLLHKLQQAAMVGAQVFSAAAVPHPICVSVSGSRDTGRKSSSWFML